METYNPGKFGSRDIDELIARELYDEEYFTEGRLKSLMDDLEKIEKTNIRTPI